MTSRQAIDQLGPYFPIFREAWLSAWRELHAKYNNPGFDNRCRSGILQNLAVIAARTAAFGKPDINYHVLETRHLFVLRGMVVLRLKKLDEDHVSSNYRTRTSEAIYRQQGLPGYEMPWLTVGLVPNQDWTAPAGVFVTCPKTPTANNWVVDITGKPQDVNAFQTEFDESLDQETPRRFRPKRTDEPDTGAEGAAV